MHAETDFLDPARKLVDEVVDWLLGRPAAADAEAFAGCVSEDGGVLSLAHVCVVVPTAQSGRNLRFALAKKVAERFPGRGLVPPNVVLPMQLAVPADDTLREAGGAEVGAAFLAFLRDRSGSGESPCVRWNRLFRKETIEDGDAAFSLLDQFSDIWKILGGGGLLMRDVARSGAARECFEKAELKGGGGEAERWEQLADFESGFFRFLRDRGLRHPAERIRLARNDPKPPDPAVRRIVLPALADPVPVLCEILRRIDPPDGIDVLLHCKPADGGKFDEWGRPRVDRWTGDARPALDRLGDDCLFCAATDAALAARVAEDFPHAADDAEPPALGLCDEGLFDALAGALSDRDFELHDPEKHRLAASSLGRIALRLVSLRDRGGGPYPWDAFAALLREDDVLSFLTRGGDARRRRDVLAGMDLFRNANFPAEVPPGGFSGPGRAGRGGDPETDVEWAAADAFAAVSRTLAGHLERALDETDDAASFVRAALAGFYGRRPLGADGEDREFEAALESLNAVLREFSDGAVRSFGLPDSAVSALLRKRLSDAVHSLEPDSDRALTTDGWLELQWSPKDRIVLAGFREGAVPESVEGHVFLPDSLRAALGLATNAQRLARDAFLLSGLLESRRRGDVHAFFSRANDVGEIHRPSRLLFFVGDAAGSGETPLARRVGLLFGEISGGVSGHPRRVAANWRPRLGSGDPSPLPGETEVPPRPRLSASLLDRWLACPFAYGLETALGMERTEEKDELAANDFGKVVHEVLQRHAEEQIGRTLSQTPQLADAPSIRDSLAKHFSEVRARYGRAPSLRVRLQFDSIWRRLEAFAPLQAGWAAAGWRIAAAEYEFTARPFAGRGIADVAIRGFVDRIDFNERTGRFRVIDYKTWDDPGKAAAHVVAGGDAQLAHARTLGLPLADGRTKDGKPTPRRFLSVQLPLYARCLEGRHDHPEKPGREALPAGGFAGRVGDLCYVVLGKGGAAVFGSADPPGGFEAGKRGAFVLSERREAAEETARVAIERIRSGLFWPPGPDGAWKRDFGGLFVLSPEKDLAGTPWLAAQRTRLAALASGAPAAGGKGGPA